MQPDKKYLEKISSQTGFQRDNLEKVWRLTVLLKRIFETPSLKDKFLLRGGTALNFIHFDIPRLSVDIDLDFIGALGKAEMEFQKPTLIKEIKELVNSLGYQTVEQDRGHAAYQFILKYTNSWGGSAQTKIDLNWLNRLPVLGKITADFKSVFPEGIASFKANTLVIEELLAGKVITFLARNEPRDLYDVYEIASGKLSYDKILLKKLVIWVGCTEEEEFGKLIKFSGTTLNENTFNQEVKPLLRRKDKLELFKVKETVNQFTRELLSFNESERSFIDKFYQKKIEPTLLFEKYSYTPDILKHPNLLWRLTNTK